MTGDQVPAPLPDVDAIIPGLDRIPPAAPNCRVYRFQKRRTTCDQQCENCDAYSAWRAAEPDAMARVAVAMMRSGSSLTAGLMRGTGGA